MIETIIKIRVYDELLGKLYGRVFHVTPTSNVSEIKKAGALLPNTCLNNESLFGNTENGFFRKRNCISFFDYRNYKTNEFQEHANKCLPTSMFNHTSSISILFLDVCEYYKLVPWIKWKEEEKWSQRVVPYVEIGYPGPVDLKYISEQIIAEYYGG